MSVILVCDGPGCQNTIPAVFKKDSSVMQRPVGWWIQPAATCVVIGCSEPCLNKALAAGKGKSP